MKDMIKNLLAEAQAYNGLEAIESLIEDGKSLAAIPMQPLYVASRALDSSNMAALLPRLTKAQRNAFLDIDLWKRDDLDPDRFDYWLEAYHQCDNDEIKQEFVTSSEFYLFLKARFNVWTFDVEDPEYPDHDYYFLTDDSLLLFEYSEDYEQVHEAKALIRELYSQKGVEHAYAYLFKLVSDSFSSLQEIEYKEKKERLRDFGFVDYYDALEYETPFPNLSMLEGYVRRKQAVTGSLDSSHENQNVAYQAIAPYAEGTAALGVELNKVNDDKRARFLNFNFVRLINASLALQDGLKEGGMAVSRVGHRTRNFLGLGLEWVATKGDWGPEGVFSHFEFTDLYRAGLTLATVVQKKIKKALRETGFENDDKFLGTYWGDFLDESFLDIPKFFRPYFPSQEINNLETWQGWSDHAETFSQMAPFAARFGETFKKLVTAGQLVDDYYLNYKVDEIDLEAILLTSFANHRLGHFKEGMPQRMGLTIDEFKKFVAPFANAEGEIALSGELTLAVTDFLKTFGMDQINGMESYLSYLVQNHLDGYDYAGLSFDEFKHVGGPILLNRQTQ